MDWPATHSETPRDMPSPNTSMADGVPAAHVHSFESGFELAYGDISTVPETEAVEVRSLTSGKVLGACHISSVKNTPLEERIIFKDYW
jgi:hypothetical protein